MLLREIRSDGELVSLVEEVGFLPFFANSVTGFSVEECCAPELWFHDDADGPWEWKGPIARSGRVAYGKFFRGKACFISREWLPEFANFRRDGYDFDARYEDGLVSRKDKEVYDVILSRGEVLSQELKRLLHYRKGGQKGFDTVITRLQMQTYVLISDFVRRKDSAGQSYGWAIARYATPETLFGADFLQDAYRSEPEVSRARVLSHLRTLLPRTSEDQILSLLG